MKIYNLDFNIMQWFDYSVILFMGMSLILNGLIAYLWHKKFYRKLGLKTYQAIQRIHLNETPRLGGFVFFLSLASFVAYCNTNESVQFIKLMLICLIPIIIVGLKEDIFHNAGPVMRLISLIFVGLLFVNQYIGPLPNISEVPFLGKLIIFQGGISFFYILSMITVANGMNLIDGVNGLCGAVSLSILCALLYLSFKTNDSIMFSVILSVILILIPFMFINYPYGKIFLGDLGAYSLGILLSMITIALFGRHHEISVWGAALILIYPVTEVIFTILRRAIRDISIYEPDVEHLHLRLFYFFRPYHSYKKISNALVTPILSVLWLFPLFSFMWFYQKYFFIWIAIFLFFVFYGILYMAVPSSKKNRID
jgi:UDP-N-acetylmuramyl pentapeptide phosphotransferase/UDP-N-acetylglucosamine-1-phosphate transferase